MAADRRSLTRRRFTARLALLSGAAITAPAALGVAGPTPRQIEGPFRPGEQPIDSDADLTRVAGREDVASGPHVLIRGRVLDADGRPVPGARLDLWQANHAGRYDHPRDRNPAPLDPAFQGSALLRTDAEGAFGLRTVLPGAYGLEWLGGRGQRCRHIHFRVDAPGHGPLTTQMYFEGDPLIAEDDVIATVPPAERARLIARRETDAPTGLPLYRFDLVVARGA